MLRGVVPMTQVEPHLARPRVEDVDERPERTRAIGKIVQSVRDETNATIMEAEQGRGRRIRSWS